MKIMKHNELITKLQPRIESLGHSVDDFDEMHYEAFHNLTLKGVEITDNLLNPNVDSVILGVYVGFAVDANPEFIPVLPYLQPGMKLRHLKLIQEALEAKNEDLLAKYVEIFSIPNISSNRSSNMANLAKMDAPYKHLANPAFSDSEVNAEMKVTFNTKFTSPSVKVNPKTGKYDENAKS